jgi:conjugative transposon TraJ protein
MQPLVIQTHNMLTGTNAGIIGLLAAKQQALDQANGSTSQNYADGQSTGQDKWDQYSQGSDDGTSNANGLSDSKQFSMSLFSFNLNNILFMVISGLLDLIYEAAALCIDTIRTFTLVVLAILGPLVLGFSVFDGLTHSFSNWLARYINVYLWLPVANIFGVIIGKVQQLMLTQDVVNIQTTGNTFFSTNDMAYIIFMLIGIVGYFTVPSVANYIVNAGGGNALLSKVNGAAMTVVKIGMTAATGGAGGGAGGGAAAGGAAGGGAAAGGGSVAGAGAAAGAPEQKSYLTDKIRGN